MRSTQLQMLGVKALRVETRWSDVAPGPARPPGRHSTRTNPVNYAWGQYDLLLSEPSAAWPVLLTVTSPVPAERRPTRKPP